MRGRIRELSGAAISAVCGGRPTSGLSRRRLSPVMTEANRGTMTRPAPGDRAVRVQLCAQHPRRQGTLSGHDV